MAELRGYGQNTNNFHYKKKGPEKTTNQSELGLEIETGVFHQ